MTGGRGPGRGARVAVPVAVVVVATAAAVAVGGRVVASSEPTTTSLEQLCAGYVDLRSSLSLQGPVTAFAIRNRASTLARLAAGYPELPQRNSMPARQAAQTIGSVLDAPYATARDLWTAMRPVAVACQDDWRAWSPALDRRLGWGGD